MAKKVVMVWRRGAFADVRTMPGVMAEVDRRLERIAAAAGPGFEIRRARRTGGRVRARGSVGTTDIRSQRRNARDHTLIKALRAGRG